MKITPELVRELLDYDQDSGVLTWRARDAKWFSTIRARDSWNTRYAGKHAGRVCDNGAGFLRRNVTLFGRPQLEHKIVWMWMTDDPLPRQIDHRNRNALDNRWRNLRPSSSLQNSHNQSMPRTNTSGVSGVCWHKTHKRWYASCRMNGKRYNLGTFLEIDEAAMAVMEFRAEHGFDPGHGIEMAHYHQECLAVGARA